MAERVHRLVEAMRRLARREAIPALRRTVEKSRPEDIANAVSHLTPAEQRLVFSQVEDAETAAAVLVQLDESDFRRLCRDIDFEYLIAILDEMEVDDEADVIALLPEEIQARVLAAIEAQDKAHVEDILTWPEDSAGGIMQPLAFRCHEDTTCRDAINRLHEQTDDLEMVFYLYVENDGGQLVGVTSLRALLTHPPSTSLSDFMTTEVITVPPETDQEDVARLVSHYDMLAIPVVDPARRLLGIVTIDDVIDVIQEEAAEDMLLMAGVADEDQQTGGSIWAAAKQRALWLFVTLGGGIAMAGIIGSFESDLATLPVLAGFIPVMMGMGGNVGIQAATIGVRNIATGHATMTGARAMLWREARVGLLMGIAFALVLGIYAYITAPTGQEAAFATAIAISILATVTAAASFGMLVPVTLERVGVDPAVATGPFVTTGIDIVAILIYFGTCQALLGL
jgi:magnesium transporter